MVRAFMNNGYIISIMYGAKDSNLSESEYLAIIDKVNQKPTPPNGYDYRLTVALEWEMYKTPVTEEDEDEEATAADYKAALAEMGVEV